jgi:hypothetical protein
MEYGSFDSLVREGGRFADLARAQFMAGAEKGSTPVAAKAAPKATEAPAITPEKPRVKARPSAGKATPARRKSIKA